MVEEVTSPWTDARQLMFFLPSLCYRPRAQDVECVLVFDGSRFVMERVAVVGVSRVAVVVAIDSAVAVAVAIVAVASAVVAVVVIATVVAVTDVVVFAAAVAIAVVAGGVAVAVVVAIALAVAAAAVFHGIVTLSQIADSRGNEPVEIIRCGNAVRRNR